MNEWLGINEDFLTVIYRLGVIIVLSGLIGYERDKKGENAGIRTIMLVGMASTGLIVTSLYYMMPLLEGGEGLRMDLARLPSYIIGGIGFIGAGTIMTKGKGVKGISTAATIWTVAVIGIIVGYGAIALAVLITFFTLFVLHIVKKIDF